MNRFDPSVAIGWLQTGTSNEKEQKTMSSATMNSATMNSATMNRVSDRTIDPVPLSCDQSVLAGYRSHYEAEKAVRRLAKEGLPTDKISMIGRSFQTCDDIQGFYRPADAALQGAEAGAWFGGICGMLTGTGLFILPVVGPVFVLGPLAGLVATAVGGAGTGALITGLVSLGIHQDQAAKYQESIHAGEFLVIVYGATSVETDRACSLLEDTSQTYLRTHCIFHGGAAAHGGTA